MLRKEVEELHEVELLRSLMEIATLLNHSICKDVYWIAFDSLSSSTGQSVFQISHGKSE